MRLKKPRRILTSEQRKVNAYISRQSLIHTVAHARQRQLPKNNPREAIFTGDRCKAQWAGCEFSAANHKCVLPSIIRTIPSALESNQISQPKLGRGLIRVMRTHRRSGIAYNLSGSPCPEGNYSIERIIAPGATLVNGIESSDSEPGDSINSWFSWQLSF